VREWASGDASAVAFDLVFTCEVSCVVGVVSSGFYARSAADLEVLRSSFQQLVKHVSVTGVIVDDQWTLTTEGGVSLEEVGMNVQQLVGKQCTTIDVCFPLEFPVMGK
jgi:hypothetical protein